MKKQINVKKPTLQDDSTASALAFAEAKKPHSTSGQVPAGDVRLTANIRQNLHLKLKIEAAKRRTTIGELLEQLIDQL